MPIILSVDHERQEVDSLAIGYVSYEDIQNHLLAERHFGGLAYKELIDARTAAIDWTPDEARQIEDTIRSLSQESKFGPTAILVLTEIDFGMVRMVETLVDGVAEIRPFREEIDARAWLDSKLSL